MQGIARVRNEIVYKTAFWAGFFSTLIVAWGVYATILGNWLATVNAPQKAETYWIRTIPAKVLFPADANRAFTTGPWWPPLDPGVMEWGALIVELAGRTVQLPGLPTPIFGVKDGKVQWIPVLIKNIDGRWEARDAGGKTFEISIRPPAPASAARNTLVTLVSQSTDRETIRTLVGPPTREQIQGEFVDALVPGCPATDCFRYQPTRFREFFEYTDRPGFEIVFSGNGGFLRSKPITIARPTTRAGQAEKTAKNNN